MADTIISPNMNLPVPIVGIDAGPDWANNLNACLNQIDAHNHTSGYGVQIPPGGLNINADLTFQSNNATALRSSRFTAQLVPLSTSSSSDIGCVYVSGYDLYYNDIVGNQVRITSGGGVAGSPGSITNLTAPASATYVSANQTFVWQSNTNVPANLDAASIILRNLTVNSKGLTLAPPSGMAADYSLILPALPLTTKILGCDSSGNINANVDADGTTLQFNANTLSVKSAGITTTQIAANTIVKGNVNLASLFPKLYSITCSTSGTLVVGSYSQIMFQGCGGGGGGGGGAAGGSGGGGGGGGAGALFSPTYSVAVTPGSTLTIKIGAGGAGGVGGGSSGGGLNGSTGDFSSITIGGTAFQFVGALGGNGGPGTGPGNGAAGGVNIDGCYTNGGAGGAANASANGTVGQATLLFNQSGGVGGGFHAGGGGGGGGGGAGSFGAGAAGGAAGQAAGHPGASAAATAYGSGGGGGGGSNNSGSPGSMGNDGGVGANGLVKIYWTDWG